MRIFVSASYSSKLTAGGQVTSEYRQRMEELILALEAVGHKVFFAARQDGWVSNAGNPAEALSLDLRELDQANVVIAFVTADPPSAGVQFELGYAYARGHQIILLRRHGDTLAFMNKGLVELKRATEIDYSAGADIGRVLIAALGRMG